MSILTGTYTKCGSQANPLYSCDRDETGGDYCGPCFYELPCRSKHPEDCETQVMLGDEE